MTIDETVDKLGQDLSLKDTKSRQRKPFQVVLVDIKKAAEDNIIHCVKKPLEENDLKFVALSYRWGELHETVIDTGVGYTATITSFDLNDFYQLCYMMTIESDTKHIDCVWVDAICVDQSPAKRKATIHQMSNIYDRATYILAVPDLHLTYLKGVSIKNDDTIEGSDNYRMYLYHLLHGHASQLDALDEAFLDDAKVPKDPPALRQLLLKNTNHFAYGLIYYNKYDRRYCPVQTLDHICETTTNQERNQHWKPCVIGSSKNLNGELHQCDETICPIDMFHSRHIIDDSSDEDDDSDNENCQFLESQWKSKILQRSNSIRQSMEFLVGLIKDWSTRVWVISEFNIAKKKNNLKYWFTQLNNSFWATLMYHFMKERENFTFFKFDFKDPWEKCMNIDYYKDKLTTKKTRTDSSNPVYIQFHYTLYSQLRRQTFLQNILISKASKNEDRFYSILPFSPYQDRILEVSHWKINTMPSVKLKLYEIMHTKDKLALLFLSGDEGAMHGNVLPTFATSTLNSTSKIAHKVNSPDVAFSNFDVKDPSTIMFYHHPKQTNNNNRDNDGDDDDDDDEDDGAGSHQPYLRLKPKEYIVAYNNDSKCHRIHSITRNKWPIFKRLGLDADDEDDASKRTFDIVSIPLTEPLHDKLPSGYLSPRFSQFLTLIGCFVRNKWILSPEAVPNAEWGHHVICHGNDDDYIDNDTDAKPAVTFFDIY